MRDELRRNESGKVDEQIRLPKAVFSVLVLAKKDHSATTSEFTLCVDVPIEKYLIYMPRELLHNVILRSDQVSRATCYSMRLSKEEEMKHLLIMMRTLLLHR